MIDSGIDFCDLPFQYKLLSQNLIALSLLVSIFCKNQFCKKFLQRYNKILELYVHLKEMFTFLKLSRNFDWKVLLYLNLTKHTLKLNCFLNKIIFCLIFLYFEILAYSFFKKESYNYQSWKLHIITIKLCQVVLHLVVLIIQEAKMYHFLQNLGEWLYNVKREGQLLFEKRFDVCAAVFSIWWVQSHAHTSAHSPLV